MLPLETARIELLKLTRKLESPLSSPPNWMLKLKLLPLNKL